MVIEVVWVVKQLQERMAEKQSRIYCFYVDLKKSLDRKKPILDIVEPSCIIKDSLERLVEDVAEVSAIKSLRKCISRVRV